MNAYELNALIDYFTIKGDTEAVKHYQYKLEQYEKEQNRD